MGIRNLLPFLRKRCPHAFLADVPASAWASSSKRRVALDVANHVYRLSHAWGTRDPSVLALKMWEWVDMQLIRKHRLDGVYLVLDGPGHRDLKLWEHRRRSSTMRRQDELLTQKKTCIRRLQQCVARGNASSGVCATGDPVRERLLTSAWHAWDGVSDGVSTPHDDEDGEEEEDAASLWGGGSTAASASSSSSSPRTNAKALICSQKDASVDNHAKSDPWKPWEHLTHQESSVFTQFVVAHAQQHVLQSQIRQNVQFSSGALLDIVCRVSRYSPDHCMVLHAAGEGEIACAALAVQGAVDVVVSNDTDVLAASAPYLLCVRGTSQFTVDTRRLLQDLGLDAHTFRCMCVLMGSDFSPYANGWGPVRSYKHVLSCIDKNAVSMAEMLAAIRRFKPANCDRWTGTEEVFQDVIRQAMLQAHEVFDTSHLNKR